MSFHQELQARASDLWEISPVWQGSCENWPLDQEHRAEGREEVRGVIY